MNAGPTQEVLAMGQIFFLHKGGCVGRISPHPVHARRHHVDRQGRAVNTCHKHVDMKSVLLTQVYCL